MAIDETLSANGQTIEKTYQDKVTGEEGTDPILKARYDIEKIRGDIYDMVGKAFQWSGLITSLLTIVYEILPDETKDLINDEKRSLIEAVLAVCKETETVSDYKLEKGGIDFILSILKEESAVVDVLKKLDETTSEA